MADARRAHDRASDDRVREQVVPANDALQADPERVVSVGQVRARLVEEDWTLRRPGGASSCPRSTSTASRCITVGRFQFVTVSADSGLACGDADQEQRDQALDSVNKPALKLTGAGRDTILISLGARVKQTEPETPIFSLMAHQKRGLPLC
ncbi:hypothetical protein [Halochromatium glycolicum]|uniref:Uncharacterized protein n=1 Tax=Halochromatium glycolicum TaxID=85075 RepID=A0AAJ0U3F1_9GAMM|nr:hypothetical protein [Halochromatium glycolicum]MBK1704383.1 hypothetical protein [Halochromatium glycolicum]